MGTTVSKPTVTLTRTEHGYFAPGNRGSGCGNPYAARREAIWKLLYSRCSIKKLEKIIDELLRDAETPPMITKRDGEGNEYTVPDYWLRHAARVEILNRLIGKPKEQVDISIQGALSHLSEEEKIAVLDAALAQRALEIVVTPIKTAGGKGNGKH